MRPLLLFCGLAVALAFARPALAHDGIDKEIAVINFQLESRPGDPDLLLARARLYRRAAQTAQAAQGTQIERALADLAEAHKRIGERRDLLLLRGLLLADKGDTAPAELALDKAIAAGAKNAEAFEARAKLRQAKGKLDRARTDLDAAIQLSKRPELYLSRARIDEARGKLDDAAAGLEEGLAALGGAVVVRLELVRIEKKRKRFEHAIALIDELIKSAPLKADYLLVRAEILEASGKRAQALSDRKSALAEIDAALARRRTDLRLVSRARALLALGRTNEAISELQSVLARSPGLYDARALLDQAKMRKNTANKAK